MWASTKEGYVLQLALLVEFAGSASSECQTFIQHSLPNNGPGGEPMPDDDKWAVEVANSAHLVAKKYLSGTAEHNHTSAYANCQLCESSI